MTERILIYESDATQEQKDSAWFADAVIYQQKLVIEEEYLNKETGKTESRTIQPQYSEPPDGADINDFNVIELTREQAEARGQAGAAKWTARNHKGKSWVSEVITV